MLNFKKATVSLVAQGVDKVDTLPGFDDCGFFDSLSNSFTCCF
jgi:hypothetical protein